MGLGGGTHRLLVMKSEIEILKYASDEGSPLVIRERDNHFETIVKYSTERTEKAFCTYTGTFFKKQTNKKKCRLLEQATSPQATH